MNKFYFCLGVGAEGLGVNAPKPRLLIIVLVFLLDLHLVVRFVQVVFPLLVLAFCLHQKCYLVHYPMLNI